MSSLMLSFHFQTGVVMRTTLTLDDALLEKASKLLGTDERTWVIHESLRALIERESARRLAMLGGSQKQLKVASRRRSVSA